jgi:hypothetical protein
MTLSIMANDLERCYAERRDYLIVMLNVVMLSVVAPLRPYSATLGYILTTTISCKEEVLRILNLLGPAQ